MELAWNYGQNAMPPTRCLDRPFVVDPSSTHRDRFIKGQEENTATSLEASCPIPENS